MYQVKAPQNSAESSDWSDWWVLTIMNPWQCRRPSCISLEGVVLGGQLDSHDALWIFSCFVFMFDFQIYIYNVHCIQYWCPRWYTQNITISISITMGPNLQDGVVVHCLNNPQREGPPATDQTLAPANPMSQMMGAAAPAPNSGALFWNKTVVFYYTVPIQGKAMFFWWFFVSCLWDLWWS